MSPLATSINADKPFVFDLTSDTATIPTDEMFDIMKAATRGDDVYQVRSKTPN
jgi:threonine aldolase